MKYKPDWPEAKERLTRIWEGKTLDRPCLAVTAPSGAPVKWPKTPADLTDRWLNPDYIVPRALATIQSRYWAGESIPSFLLMAGWLVCFKATPQFAPTTIWHDPVRVDYQADPGLFLDADNPWMRLHEKLYLAMLDAAGYDDFLVGQPCILPANDLLPAMLGTEEFLLAVAEHPQWVDQALAQMTQALLQEKRRLASLARARHAYWYGNAGWMPFWAPQPFNSTQSDVSCMLSCQMFDRYVMPELRRYADEHGGLWYHLDGPNAKHHLPSLLSIQNLRVVQYVSVATEPPNGVGQIPLYRQIQQAGRIVHVHVPPGDVEELIRQLDPSLLMLMVEVDTPRQADDLLASAKRWTAAKKK